jgi:hypothetical protein
MEMTNRIGWMDGELTDEQRDILVKKGYLRECGNCNQWHLVEADEWKGIESVEAYDAIFARVDAIKAIAPQMSEGFAMLMVRGRHDAMKEKEASE